MRYSNALTRECGWLVTYPEIQAQELRCDFNETISGTCYFVSYPLNSIKLDRVFQL